MFHTKVLFEDEIKVVQTLSKNYLSILLLLDPVVDNRIYKFIFIKQNS